VHESHSEAEVALDAPWSGGGSPFAINSKKLGMWLFIVSDTLTFSALLLAYTYERLANPDWPRPFEIFPSIVNATVMTVILLFSSLTMVMGVAAAHKNDRKAAVRWLLFTALGGILFDILHLREWFKLFSEGFTAWGTPGPAGGVPLFGATFFGITGMHMTHVTVGVIYLIVVAVGYGRGKFDADDVEVSGLYWHFVDLVWMFVFPMIYLMSINLKG
jgi:cytochrome c oxidase subunit 3